MPNSLLRAVVVLAFQAAAVNAQNCPHGLTANDIAAKSSLNLNDKVSLVTDGRSGLVSTIFLVRTSRVMYISLYSHIWDCFPSTIVQGCTISEALLTLGRTKVIASRDEAKNQEAVQNLTSTVSDVKTDVSRVRTFAADCLETHSRLDELSKSWAGLSNAVNTRAVSSSTPMSFITSLIMGNMVLLSKSIVMR